MEEFRLDLNGDEKVLIERLLEFGGRYISASKSNDLNVVMGPVARDMALQVMARAKSIAPREVVHLRLVETTSKAKGA